MSKDYVTPWDNRMLFEMALGIEGTEDILNRYGVDLDTYQKWIRIPAFIQRIEEYKVEAREKGLSFKQKAKVQAEDHLNTAYTLIHHPDCPFHVKADLIKWTAKMAELEPATGPGSMQGGNQPLLDAESIKKIADGELEVQVARIVARRKGEVGEVTEFTDVGVLEHVG